MLITIIFIAIIASIFIADTIATKKLKKKREKDYADYVANGIYAEGKISRVKCGGSLFFDYTNYVKYIGDDNIEHEAIVVNMHINSAPYNKIIGISYIPGKYEECICVDYDPNIKGR